MIRGRELESLKYKKAFETYEEFRHAQNMIGNQPSSEKVFHARNLYCARRNKQCLGCGLRKATGFWDRGTPATRGWE